MTVTYGNIVWLVSGQRLKGCSQVQSLLIGWENSTSQVMTEYECKVGCSVLQDGQHLDTSQSEFVKFSSEVS